MKKFEFSESLVRGKSSYERFAVLQCDILNQEEDDFDVYVNLQNKLVSFGFVFLLACLPYIAIRGNKKFNKFYVDSKTLSKMKKIKVPGTTPAGEKVEAGDMGFCHLNDEDDVIRLSNTIIKHFPVGLSDALNWMIHQGICEVFNNAKEHSNASHVLASWYTKETGVYCFSCYDTGIGIPESVKRYFRSKGIPLSYDTLALNWAIKRGNSTSERRPNPGLGLDILKNFAEVNMGAIYIASGYSLYSLKNGKESYSDLKHPILGTYFEMDIVNQNVSYSIEGEKNESNS